MDISTRLTLTKSTQSQPTPLSSTAKISDMNKAFISCKNSTHQHSQLKTSHTVKQASTTTSKNRFIKMFTHSRTRHADAQHSTSKATSLTSEAKTIEPSSKSTYKLAHDAYAMSKNML